MKRRFVREVFFGTLVGLTLAMAGTSLAIPVGPVFPAPGGTTFLASGGLIGDVGGRTFSYSGFDTNQFSTLYWGPSATNLPQAALDGSLDPAAFYSASGTTATWVGTTSWINPSSPFQTIPSVPWLAQITVTGLGTNPWVLASSLGLAPAIGFVVDNSSGLNFSANIQFLANVGSGDAAMNTIQQPFASNLTKTSFAGGFYYDAPTAVPEASTVFLLGAGLLIMGGYVWRRERTQPS